ncbi:MAG: ABC transporter permease [Clostridium sp.]|nr:ABC transporter permease [Clostridium sp.]
MKQFYEVLRFELGNYFKSKSYLITTLIMLIVFVVGLSVPRFLDLSSIFGGSSDDKKVMVLYDKDKVIPDTNILEECFQGTEWKVADSKDEVEDLVKSKDAKAGFVVNGELDYSYIIENSDFSDEKQASFEKVLSTLYRNKTLESKGINVAEVEALYNTQVTQNVEILGKDSVNNFAYTYGLIFIVYMIVVMYGQLIAVSVTTEKSNRTMEVLVTSTSSNSLIFGKVVAGTIASLFQVGVILASALVTYNFNSDAWNHKLDFIFNIPSEVLAIFAVFGLLGLLFYSFIFGALGALVSKTEDVSKSIGPVTLIFVVAFMLVITNLTNAGGMIIKVLSYVPFSSCISMFVRVAMGSVEAFEIIISLAILLASTAIVAVIGAKIYRRATLMYGNQIKLVNALKWLKK